MTWTRFDPVRREVLLALGLSVALELELGFGGRLSSPGGAAAALLITVPIAFRLRFPLATMAVVAAGGAFSAAVGVFNGSGFPVTPVISVVLALYAVGSRTGGVRLAVGAGAALAGLLGGTLLSSHAHGGDFFLDVLIIGCGLLIGRALGVLRFESDVFAQRASELERERDERSRVAVAEERLRISRELHDVIGHSISIMGVQAGAVRSVLRDDEQREREALLAVERIGRQAVGEMRRLIGLLRPDQIGVGDPTPSLRRVDNLVNDMRAAGLAVRLRVEGDVSALSPGVDLAGFRIVQEALTNVLKHAPSAQVEATVNCSKHELEIEVVDDGNGRPLTRTGDIGHGLVGMLERAALYGGDLVTGPTGAGGFAVHARIPLEVA